MPSGSVDAEPSTDTARPLAAEVNDAVGGLVRRRRVTVTGCVVVPVAPPLSVTVSVTV